MLKGPYSNTVTKESRQKAWESVTVACNLSNPCHKPRDRKEVQKKWDNMKTTAVNKIREYKARLTGTGGGPPPNPLDPLTVKIAGKILGEDSPNFPGNIIQVRVDCITL